MFGDLFVNAGHRFLLRFCLFLPLYLVLFLLELFHSFCGFLTGYWLSPRLLTYSTQNIIFLLWRFGLNFLHSCHFLVFPIIFFLESLYLLLQIDHYILDFLIIQVIFKFDLVFGVKKVKKFIDLFLLALLYFFCSLGPCRFFFLIEVIRIFWLFWLLFFLLSWLL